MLVLVASVFVVNAENEQLRVEILEYVDQEVSYNPLETGAGIFYDLNENQSKYNLTGYIVVSNQNPEGRAISDIYLSFSNLDFIEATPTYYSGRTGTFLDSNKADGSLVLHIPEVRSGENSTWIYSIDNTLVYPPLNFTSNYSATKALAGDNITITDNISNNFLYNSTYQSDTCIHNIVITQNQTPINFSGSFYNYYFNNRTGYTYGPDAGNVTYSTDNETQTWNALGGGCLNFGESTSITYMIYTPLNIPTSQTYNMVNSTLSYKLNSSISQMRLVDIYAVSGGNISFEKKIEEPSDPILYGSNVTWNVTGYFTVDTNITYRLYNATFWVSQRNVNGAYTDPNTIDNDSISNESLWINYTNQVLVNYASPWTSANWLFNYSDIPSPIVWMEVNFTINNDGTQLVNRSIVQNGRDIHIKELYLIIGYWLEVNKNVTSIAQDIYNIRINVHNKGNQVTPQSSVVTVYDFVPTPFNDSISPRSFSNSSWYTTSEANTSVNGSYNGLLFQWALIPTNSLNTSFAAGPEQTTNTTWSVEYNVTGTGDYNVLDVFITGLDPQKVDGAGSTKAVIVSQLIDKIKSTEGIFAVVAGILLLLGLLA